MEIDKNEHSDRNIDCQIKRQNAIDQELGCKFIRIEPDKEDLDIFKTINEIFKYIKQSTKTTLTNKFMIRLPGLEFESDNVIKSKAMKFIVKKIFPDY